MYQSQRPKQTEVVLSALRAGCRSAWEVARYTKIPLRSAAAALSYLKRLGIVKATGYAPSRHGKRGFFWEAM